MNTTIRHIASIIFLCASALTTFHAHAHGNVTPQGVDTTGLPSVGDKWLEENPFKGNKTALKIGSSAFNQNCARCHGLEAISGGIAPDLRLLDRDCVGLKNETKKQACYKEIDGYYLASVRNGKVRLEEQVLAAGSAAGLKPVLVLINRQQFTKTANCWGVTNNAKGTNTNRIVLFQKP